MNICKNKTKQKLKTNFKKWRNAGAVIAAHFSKSTHAESTGQKLIRVTGLQDKKWGGEEIGGKHSSENNHRKLKRNPKIRKSNRPTWMPMESSQEMCNIKRMKKTVVSCSAIAIKTRVVNNEWRRLETENLSHRCWMKNCCGHLHV